MGSAGEAVVCAEVGSKGLVLRLGDRRRRPTPFLSRHTLCGGRRAGDRRAGGNQDAFVDRHGPWLFLTVMVVVGLNTLDTLFTALLLSRGAQEMNPLVDAVVRHDVTAFVVLKSFGIGLGIALFCMTKNFLVARIGLGIVVAGYSALLLWHLVLMSSLDAP